MNVTLTQLRSPAAAAVAGTLLASAFLFSSGCQSTGSKEASAATETPRKAAGASMEVEVRPELVRSLRLGQSEWRDVGTTLEAAGRLEADETRMARIGAPATGRLTELDVVEGQMVKRGQRVATLYSTELSGAQFAYVKGISQQNLARRSVDRARQLLAADVIGAAELQRREAELLEAEAELSSVRDQLRVLGMSDEAIARLERTRTVDSVTELTATIDGIVMERHVTLGQVVQPADTVAVIADLRNIWLVADIPEQNAGGLRVGVQVEARIPALNDFTVRGRLSFVSAMVNPETRTVRCRMDLDNPQGRFKPAMLATMTLRDGAQRQRVVPDSAIVRDGNGDFLYVQVAERKFRMQPVQIGAEVDGGHVLLGGVNEKDVLVLDGAFHLNNERKRLAIQGS